MYYHVYCSTIHSKIENQASADEWIKKMSYAHTEYYSTAKNNEISLFEVKRLELKVNVT